MFDVVTRKHQCWEYEEETRLLLSKIEGKLNHDELFLTIKECGLEIKAIYAGCKVSNQDREIVAKIIETKSYPIEMKMAINTDIYKATRIIS